MAITVYVPGPAVLKIAVPSGSLQSLGYARNETEIMLQPYWNPIPSDEFGGDPGPPAEFQLLGVTATIRMRLSKFDKDVADIVEKFASQASVIGTPISPGTLGFASNHSLRVLIDSPTGPRNFLRCLPTGPSESNHGTKAMEKFFEFTAYEDANGVLWNEVDT